MIKLDERDKKIQKNLKTLPISVFTFPNILLKLFKKFSSNLIIFFNFHFNFQKVYVVFSRILNFIRSHKKNLQNLQKYPQLKNFKKFKNFEFCKKKLKSLKILHKNQKSAVFISNLNLTLKKSINLMSFQNSINILNFISIYQQIFEQFLLKLSSHFDNLSIEIFLLRVLLMKHVTKCGKISDQATLSFLAFNPFFIVHL